MQDNKNSQMAYQMLALYFLKWVRVGIQSSGPSKRNVYHVSTHQFSGPVCKHTDRIDLVLMLITQPSIMWIHGGFCSSAYVLYNWFSTLFPRVLVSGLMSWSLYVVLTGLHSESHPSWIRTFQIIITAMFVLSMYTYFKVIIVGAGSPLDFPELKTDGSKSSTENPYSATDEANERLLGNDPSTARSPPQELFASHTFKNNAPAYRWCSTCGVWKPDRCHHCSTCQKCFLRMDHHCPWFSACIGFYNHKFFIQSLIYITVYCMLTLCVSGATLFEFFWDQDYSDSYISLNMVFLFVTSLAFFVAVGLFSAFSLYMVLKNYTTIEFQDIKWQYSEIQDSGYEFDADGKKRRLGHIYDLGACRNWQAVMGTSWVSWVLPIAVTNRKLTGTFNNGINFEVDEELFEKYRHNAEIQQQLNRQLAEYRDRVRGVR
ncbi:DHHC palmitoyltransferase family protein [Clavispora lusitaniae]|uniref:DHHC palmitoyltransferase family protein n=1 Tax=Clavispora lusitaniae TaxID=36911 RepID=UPI00202BF579|nr:DHHC palmitoyltransferase family protein [Clavispora lusitaniae]